MTVMVYNHMGRDGSVAQASLQSESKMLCWDDNNAQYLKDMMRPDVFWNKIKY